MDGSRQTALVWRAFLSATPVARVGFSSPTGQTGDELKSKFVVATGLLGCEMR